MISKNEKCSNTQINRIVIHKDNEEKRIYQYELDDFIKNGWIKGMSDTHKKVLSNKHLGKTSWNKGKNFSKETRNKISKSLKGNIPWNKGKQGVQKAWNKGLTKETDERVKKISNSKVGHEVSKETRDKIRNLNLGKRLSKEKLLIKTTKEYLTKKKNNSFNKSSKEEEFYKYLLNENINKTIYRQYKDINRYPFYCDFYILEDDLFIELNLHWTHGGRPFDSNDEECLKQLEIWQEKAKTSQFYQNAIQTWTVRDVEKQRIAKENNLNYKIIY